MKRQWLFIASVLLTMVTIGIIGDACTQADQAKLQSAACVAQAVANAATASGQNAGDEKLAAAGSVASVALGALCTGLPSDTPLTVQPQAVSVL